MEEKLNKIKENSENKKEYELKNQFILFSFHMDK